MILSRQNIKDLPSEKNDRYADALQSAKGAYIVEDCKGKPDIILIASGSEVSTLVEGASLLRKDNLNVRIVSAPSEGLIQKSG